MKDLYYLRWKTYFDSHEQKLNGEEIKPIDYYATEEAWTNASNAYSSAPVGESIETCKRIFTKVLNRD